MWEIKELKMTCEVFPSQWEGILKNGEQVYIRYRHGGLSVKVSKRGTDLVEGKQVIFIDDDTDSGVMSNKELREILKGIIKFPENIK